MALNPQNPQRGTGVRKQATGVRPAVPASAPAPAAAPGTGRSTATRRPGAPAPAGGAARPALRSSAPKQGGKGTKYLMLGIIGALALMVAYLFIPIGGKAPLGIRMARMWGLLPKPGAEKPAAGEGPVVGLDGKYQFALDVRKRAQAFIEDQQKFKDQPQALTDVEIHRVLSALEKFRDEVYLSVDDLTRVAEANGKETTIDANTAREEQKKQKAFAMELGQQVMKWKGPKDQIFVSASAPEFVAAKFAPPDPSKKPEEKKDPSRFLTVVAPANPNDVPKPVEPPKEDPKPEPEKPKEEPKPAEPKPEPEKPKPAEPEKPKPAEPEKPKPVEPKPEPEKPKEEPKPAEPKPEPEKPKPAEPKPEPEKPKEEPKPAEPKPEPKVEKKVDVVVAEADKLVLDGTPLAKDVIGGARNLPTDPEKLKTLSMKAETAKAFFTKAREAYAGIKDSAPESADVAAKMTKIEKVLALLQNAADAIDSKK